MKTKKNNKDNKFFILINNFGDGYPKSERIPSVGLVLLATMVQYRDRENKIYGGHLEKIPYLRLTKNLSKKEYINYWPKVNEFLKAVYPQKISAKVKVGNKWNPIEISCPNGRKIKQQEKEYPDRDIRAYYEHKCYKKSFSNIYQLSKTWKEGLFTSIDAVKKAIKRVEKDQDLKNNRKRFWEQ